MQTVPIGKRLVHAINKHYGKDYTPRTFFENEYFPTFYANSRYLFTAGNSPVFQAYNLSVRKNNPVPLTRERLAEVQKQYATKIVTDGKRDASIYLGGPSSDVLDSTSGQVTGIELAVPPEDVYASWIGAGLGITVEGGLSLLIDDEDVLLTLFEGWKVYRQILDEIDTLKPNQVNTWNGQWLTHVFNPDHIPGEKWVPATDKEGGALSTQSWVQLLFGLCWKFKDTPTRTINAYVYSFGQTNRTAGFIRFNLPEARSIGALYRTLFTVPEGLPSKNFEALYKTEFSFSRAFQCGEVGLRAIQPKDLHGYMDGRKQPKYSENDPAKAFLFQTHLLWIIAMLKNQDLIDKAEQLAQVLRDYAGQDQRGKMTNARQVDQLLGSSTRIQFIDRITEVVKEHGSSNAKGIDSLVVDLVNMPDEKVPLFLTLLRFKHAYLSVKPVSTAS